MALPFVAQVARADQAPDQTQAQQQQQQQQSGLGSAGARGARWQQASVDVSVEPTVDLLGNKAEAAKAFQEAAKDPRMAKAANLWLKLQTQAAPAQAG